MGREKTRGRPPGFEVSQETRDKISRGNKGRKQPQEEIDKRGEACRRTWQAKRDAAREKDQKQAADSLQDRY